MSESASGEADSSSTDAGKNIVCPDCGAEYQSTQGVRYHLKHTDCTGFECEKCGQDHNPTRESVARHIARSHGGGESYTDSRVSDKSWFKTQYVENGKSTTEIANIVGLKPPTVRGWKRKHGIETVTDHKNRGSGEDNPTWTDNTTITTCVWCAEEIEIRTQRVKRAENNFCDLDCLARYVSENRVGENHPLHKGGEYYYGPKWRTETRELVRQRDNYTCQRCGVHESELDRELDVHHLIPANEFDDIADANEVDNLVCYCRSCHNQWEGIPLRPDRRRDE